MCHIPLVPLIQIKSSFVYGLCWSAPPPAILSLLYVTWTNLRSLVCAVETFLLIEILPMDTFRSAVFVGYDLIWSGVHAHRGGLTSIAVWPAHIRVILQYSRPVCCRRAAGSRAAWWRHVIAHQSQRAVRHWGASSYHCCHLVFVLFPTTVIVFRVFYSHNLSFISRISGACAHVLSHKHKPCQNPYSTFSLLFSVSLASHSFHFLAKKITHTHARARSRSHLRV